MVNGPRPQQLNTPASANAASSPQNGTTPSRSPLLLQRQATSIYSTCSTSTPMLVYGKAATPLAGAWSDAPWEATFNVDVPPPAALTDPAAGGHGVHDDDDDVRDDFSHHDDNSSVAETTAWAEKSAAKSAGMSRNNSTEADDVTAEAAPTPRAAAERQSKAHVSRVYRRDPYAFEAVCHEVYRCECDACLDAAVVGNDRILAANAYDMMGRTNTYSEMATDVPTMSYEIDDGASTAPSAQAAGFGRDAYADPAAWDARQAEAEQPVSNFMPPPPPPKITRGVIAESSEPALDVDAAFYHITMRWYAKVARVQHKWVADDEACPGPCEEVPFDEWVAEAGKWWLRHFEHLQVKTSASSGLLRTGAAAVPEHARTGGFETHATITASYIQHRTALRTGPRRQRGTSGLTATMLESLPLPRSRVQELPW